MRGHPVKGHSGYRSGTWKTGEDVYLKLRAHGLTASDDDHSPDHRRLTTEDVRVHRFTRLDDDPRPTIGSRRWISIPTHVHGTRGLCFGVSQRQQPLLEVLGVMGGDGLFEQLVNDGQEVVQGSDPRQRRRALAAESTASGAKKQSRLNSGEGNVSLVEVPCDLAVPSARARGRPGKPEVALEDRFNVDAAGIGHAAAIERRWRACR